MPEPYTQQNSPIRFKAGTLGDDDLLITRFSGVESLSELYEFELDLIAPVENPVAFEDVLGNGGVVALDIPDGETRFFQGIVSRFAQGENTSRFTTYKATLVPPVWLLTKRVQSRIFQHISVPDILKKVFEGFDVTQRLQGTFHPRDYCVQYRETDFAFASRLMEEEGMYYYFVHTEDGVEMVISNHPQGHDPVPDPKTLIFETVTAAGGEAHEEGRITGWRKVQEVRSSLVTLWDHNFELPDKHLEADQKIQETVAVGSVTHKISLPAAEGLELYDFPGGYAGRFDGITPGGGEQPAELEKIFEDNRRTARLRIQEEASGAVAIEGVGSCRQMTAGHTFTLERHPDADGDYVLTRVRHEAGMVSGGYESGDATFDYKNDFYCTPAELPFRPARVTPKPTISGTQTAVVVGPAGEEIFTDKYSRIKVQFHWDREGKFDADSSCWIRVATIWAGKNWGVIHIPRIGQEVVVDFLEGDPDQPIVIGSVYNADQMPPGNLPKEGMVSGLQSRSTPKGGPPNFNGMRANDTKGKEALDVQAEYDMNTLVKHNDTQTVVLDRKIDVTGKHDETITKNTTITILEGKYSHDVQKGTSTSHVKDAVIENYDNKQTTTVAEDIAITSNKGTVKIKEMAGKMHLFASGLMEIKSDTADTKVYAATSILLQVGASSLEMKSDGTIKLSGSKIEVTGTAETKIGVSTQSVTCSTSKVEVSGAAVNSSAVGMHEITGAVVKLN